MKIDKSAKHMVTLFRSPIDDTKPKELHMNSRHRIGATLMKSGGGINTGLTREEEERILPGIISMSSTDVRFRERVQQFYMDLSVEVPFVGQRLDITLDKTGMPENPIDYLKYKFVLCDPSVAQDDVDSKRLGKLYYIHDDAKEAREQFDKIQSKKDSYREFIKVAADSEKAEMVLRVFGTAGLDILDDEKREIELERLALKDPVKFVAIARDKDLELRFLISNAVEYGHLTKQGTAYLQHDLILGHTEDEAVVFLKNPENSVVLSTIKSQVQEVVRRRRQKESLDIYREKRKAEEEEKSIRTEGGDIDILQRKGEKEEKSKPKKSKMSELDYEDTGRK